VDALKRDGLDGLEFSRRSGLPAIVGVTIGSTPGSSRNINRSASRPTALESD